MPGQIRLLRLARRDEKPDYLTGLVRQLIARARTEGTIVTDEYETLISKKIKEAEGGNTEAAKWLLERFCCVVNEQTGKDGKQLISPSGPVNNLSFELLSYLSRCFELILEGAPAGKALGIDKGESGVPSKQSEISQRNFSWCLEILDLTEKQGLGITLAIDRVAKENGFSISTVKNAWSDYRLVAELHRRLEKSQG